MDRVGNLAGLTMAMIEDMSTEEIQSYAFDRLYDELDEENSDDELYDMCLDYDIGSHEETDIFQQNGFTNEADFWRYKEG